MKSEIGQYKSILLLLQLKWDYVKRREREKVGSVFVGPMSLNIKEMKDDL